MKTVKKETLDELIRLTRKYKTTGDTDIIYRLTEVARKTSIEAFGNAYKWSSFQGFVGALVGVLPLTENCTNEMVYAMLGMIGLHVSGLEEQHYE